MKIKIEQHKIQPKTSFIIGAWAFACCCAVSPEVNSDATWTALITALIVSIIHTKK